MACGYRVQFDGSGAVISTLPTSRQIGTTVLVSGLFSSLPVRRREAMSRRKENIRKTCNMIAQYAVIKSPGFKISLFDAKRFDFCQVRFDHHVENVEYCHALGNPCVNPYQKCLDSVNWMN